MLKSLRIANFALIDDLEMTFESGLSALTGETGAGKSIILESLNLLFGKRSDAQMIRHGAQKAVVFGRFALSDAVQKAYSLGDTIEVEREIDQSGRHIMRLNNEVVTLAKIKDVMQKIGLIHRQLESMTLFDKTYYTTFIDQMDIEKTDTLRNQYLFKRENYLECQRSHERLKAEKKESIEKADFYQFQIQELKNLSLRHHEKIEIEERIEKMKNHDRILQQLREANQIFSEEVLPIDRIYQAHRALDKISHLDSSYEKMSERLSSTYYELEDTKSELYQALSDLDFDEATYLSLQERLYTIEKIENKYQKSQDELIDYLIDIEKKYRMITDYDAYLEESEKKVEQAFESAFLAGLKLSECRKALSIDFTKEILDQLKDLDLEKTTFEIVFEPIEKSPRALLESGLDQIEFMISLNEGEPIKPLTKVASGGESARFMFALRTTDALRNHLSLLILDEIDIGISGKTAAKVAKKMIELAKHLQLIVITHLPQVAARADHHYEITKIKEDDRMVTRIKYLDYPARIEAIALMLSDEKLSSFAIEQAKMLLDK